MKHFEELYKINVNDKTETLEQGRTRLTYLSWTWAWAEVKKRYPDATYSIEKFLQPDGRMLPYMVDDNTGYMVMTTVTIEGLTHEMWLPVMDGANKAMKPVPYSYKVKEYDRGRPTGKFIDKFVEAATMFDVNKTIMRCLTKNLAMFGLGLYIYAGEDLPEADEEKPESEPKKEPKKKAPPVIVEPPKEEPSLIQKKAKLKSMCDDETWNSLIEKQGLPSEWTDEQVTRWIQKKERSNNGK